MSYPSGVVPLPLIYPITVGDKEIKSLSVRRPKVRDNLIADKQNKLDADKEVHLMALLSGVDTEVIHELDMEDYSAMQAVLKGFRKKPEGSNDSENETSSGE